MKKYSIFILLSIIVLAAGLLRFYRISEVPVSPYWDEVAIGYNAYAIAQTGKDEYGQKIPLLFRSFDDYKTPGYIYTSVPFVKAFGLNEFSVRASSALFGTITVLMTFFLVKEMLSIAVTLQKKRNYLTTSWNNFAVSGGLLSAVFLAISPWHIQFSRAGFEANVGLFFVVSGGYFFMRWVTTYKNYAAFLSTITFALSLYFYRSIVIFVPLLLLGLIIIFRKHIWQHKKTFLIAVILFFILIGPFLPFILSKDGLKRGEQVSVTTSSFSAVVASAKKQQEAGNSLMSKIIYNRRLIYANAIVTGYVSHFSPQFLFISGDINGRHGPRDMGLLYLWEIPFLLLGTLVCFSLASEIRNTIFLWLLLAPIPAAISIPAPHALRSLNILPMPQMLTMLGILGVYWCIAKKYRVVFVSVLSVVIVVFFCFYVSIYYGKSAMVTSADWGDGYKQLLQYVFLNENKYDKIVISGHYWKPYIYVLFYKKYDPKMYQLTGNEHAFANYAFGGIRWGQGEHELGNEDLQQFAKAKHILVALSPDEYALQRTHLHELQRIYNHNNEVVFIISDMQ